VPFFTICNCAVILETLNNCMDKNNKTYRSIFISDVHLGTKDCKAEALNNFLKNNSCETLYLVGDIIDAWKIKQNKWRWKQSHSNVVVEYWDTASVAQELYMLLAITMSF
jgi:hypothetical protein